MAGTDEQKPVDPAGPRERLRSWLSWLPAWFLVPIGLGSGDMAGLPLDYPPGGYGGPLDSGGGGFGGSDTGGGGLDVF